MRNNTIFVVFRDLGLMFKGKFNDFPFFIYICQHGNNLRPA